MTWGLITRFGFLNFQTTGAIGEFRCGNMEQGFSSQQDVLTAGLVDVDAQVDFDGFGMLL